MKCKVWFVGDGYLLDHTFEVKGRTFADKFNNILEQLYDYVQDETCIERYDIDRIEVIEE